MIHNKIPVSFQSAELLGTKLRKFFCFAKQAEFQRNSGAFRLDPACFFAGNLESYVLPVQGREDPTTQDM